MLSCSTHGRVPSAARARSGQPRGQYMPGTDKTTSRGSAGASVVVHPGARMPRVTTPRIDRKTERIGIAPFGREGVWVGGGRPTGPSPLLFGDDFPREPFLFDRLQHPRGGQPRRVIADVEQVFFQLDIDLLNPRKPYQGFSN